MLESYVRKHYQAALVDPVAALLAGSLSPNAATLLSLVAGLAAAPLIAGDYGIAAAAMLLLSGYFDTLDGTLARLTGKSTAKGALYDIMADRCVECAVIIALFLLDTQTRGLGALCMLASVLLCVSTFLMAGIFLKNESGKSFNYTPGLMERPEAFALFLLMIALPGWFSPLALLFTALVLFTAAWRMVETVRALEAT